ncbi:hypothetical protein [Ruminococcus albus]|uniref:hypothetical protein n=1 Tax=Ruminococcus albus TaxID=1264 RepID=UPI00056D7C2D|nr:hypothetical protein [Ruminococcus albus]MCC3351823.1 hypothetical protein [Ruminococcus albus 8]
MNNSEEKIKRIEDKYSKVFTKLLIGAAISGIIFLVFLIQFITNLNNHIHSNFPFFGMAVFGILARFLLKAAYYVAGCSERKINAMHHEEQIADQRFMQQNKIHAQFVQQEQQRQFQEQQRQFNDWSTQESLKSVTPFEMGGYDMNQGNSFNNNNFNNF